MNATEQVARFIEATNYEHLPPEAVRIAKGAILDSFGVALAGSHEPAGRILAEHVAEMGGTLQASLWGWPLQTSAPQAALANGTMAHALDFDDTAFNWMGHPTVALLPAILALGEAHHISGKEVLTAYIVGFEVGSRAGQALGPPHYNRGWHATCTLGALGAAAACAKILRLSVAQTRAALGIAASQASGLRQNFGSMTKPLHAGLAGRSGVVAVLLAQKGFTADEAILESPLGYCAVFGDGRPDSAAKIAENLGAPLEIVAHGVTIKPYPCCRGTHRCIDAMLHLVRAHHPRPEEVVAVTCLTSARIPEMLIHHRPQTPLEAKFSLEYCMAIALLEKEVRLAQFDEKKVRDPRVLSLETKVHYRHPEVEPTEWLGGSETVTVRLRDGRQLSHEVAEAKGDPKNPLTEAELAAKYRDCASMVLSPQAVERSLEMLSHLERVIDITSLMQVVSPIKAS